MVPMTNPSFKEYLLTELYDQSEVNDLESHLDSLFADMGIDVEFSRHFVERILGREQDITKEEINHAFVALKKLHADKLMKGKETGRYKAVLKDFQNSVNVVFDLQGDTLNTVTVMRKSPNDFKGSDFKDFQQLKVW